MTLQDQLKAMHADLTQKLGKAPYLGPYVHCSHDGWTAAVNLRTINDDLRSEHYCTTMDEALDQLRAKIDAFSVPTPDQLLKQKLEEAYAYAEEHGLQCAI